MPDLDEVLLQVQKKRSYLLPHHGLLAASTPALLQAYDDLYSKLTLTSRHLSRHDHEWVWLGVLMAKDENLGTHHVKKFLDADGTEQELVQIAALTAFAKGAGNYDFITNHWLPHLEGFHVEAAYGEGFRATTFGQSPQLFHLTACAVHMCCGQWNQLGWQIKLAYQDQVSELGLVEALSLAMLPAGVPSFSKAAAVWRELINNGEVQASEDFTQWANLPGQGGYDESVGL